MRPTDCARCADIFNNLPLLQAEVTHIAAIEGPKVARAMADEELESYHEGHNG